MMVKCDYCETLMDEDVHAEESGMCLDCSNKFWSHSDDGHSCSWGCAASWYDDKEAS